PEPSAPVVVEARPPEKKPEFVAKAVVLDEPFPTRAPDKAASPIQFRVQLAASPRPIDIRKGKWAGLPYTIEVIEEGRLNKYQISRFQSFESANAVRKELQHLGFKDAFVVAYQNGRRIDVAKARQASTTRH
ncbi:MAG: SPOR domain-containing protein, partial [Bacteroidetes bacterium]